MNDINKNKKHGFTLLEALVATILIGIAIASLVASSGAFTKVNGAGLDISTAEFLIEEIREYMISLSYDDLAGSAGTYSPPIDVSAAAMNEFSAFSQQVVVETVLATDFETSDPGSDFSRVTVNILLNNRQISSTNWIRARQ